MRSKTSSFDRTVFKKNITRFAPVWAGYLGCLLLGMILLAGDKADYWRANHFAALFTVTAIINCGFAFLVAAVLYGDLYVSRMCNALHAMPMTRACWFNTHLVTGLLFSLVPTTIMALCTIPLLIPTPVEKAWCIGLYWLAVANLQYLFFFGLATLCAFCVGSRVGLAGIYAIVNFASFMALILVEYLYTPMLHGVVTPYTPFQLLCPLFYFSSGDGAFLDMKSWQVKEGREYVTYGSYTLADGWIYLLVLAFIGIVLLLAARRLYQKRDLEAAGDLLAFRKLEPLFTVITALVGSAMFMVACVMVSNPESTVTLYIFLFLGLAVGWFAAKMLIDRSLQVFQGKNLKGLLILAAVLGGSLILNSFDPFGIETWVPEVEEVKSVTLENSYRSTIKLEDPEDIADILNLHQFSVEQRLTDDVIQAEREAIAAAGGESYDYPGYLYYNLKYELENGWTSNRQYQIRVSDEASNIIRRHISTLDAIFYHGSSYGEYYDEYGEWVEEIIFSPDTREELLSYAQEPLGITIGSVSVPKAQLSEQMVIDLFNAIADDCEAGTLAQEDSFHPSFKIIWKDSELYQDEPDYHIQSGFGLNITLNKDLNICLDVYADSQHIIDWAAENAGITWDQMIRKAYNVSEYEIEPLPFQAAPFAD